MLCTKEVSLNDCPVRKEPLLLMKTRIALTIKAAEKKDIRKVRKRERVGDPLSFITSATKFDLRTRKISRTIKRIILITVETLEPAIFADKPGK